jgi:hypothetical protein
LKQKERYCASYDSLKHVGLWLLQWMGHSCAVLTAVQLLLAPYTTMLSQALQNDYMNVALTA